MSPDSRPSLSTRWSMIQQLDGSQAEDAWRWFLRRYRPFARSVLHAMLGTRGRGSEVDAALDEFWGYLFGSDVIGRADPQRRFRSYLAGTLRNYARDYCRRNPAVPAAEDPPDPHEEPSLPEDQEIALFARQVLRLALGQLDETFPDQSRSVRWFYGIDATDAPGAGPAPASRIAERLGIKPNAVHQLLNRGRRRLRDLIVAELRHTVEPVDLDDEIDGIFQALNVEAPGLIDV